MSKPRVLDQVRASLKNEATVYDSTHSYTEGDLCIYDNILYRCNTGGGSTLPVTGVFSPSKWDEITLCEILGDMNETIGGISRYRIMSSVTVQGSGFPTIGGQWIPSTTYTDYPYEYNITITKDTHYTAFVLFDLQEASSGNYAPVCRYSARGLFTSDIIIYAKTAPTEDITIPIIILYESVSAASDIGTTNATAGAPVDAITGTLSAGDTAISLLYPTTVSIDDVLIDVYTSPISINYESISISNGAINLTYPEQLQDISLKVVLRK